MTMINLQQLKYLFVLLSGMCMTACYPVYKTLQPELNVQIQDEQGQLLDQVPVMLMREPSVGMGYRYSVIDTQQGLVHFPKLAEWRVEFMLIHGAVDYRWYVCVAKPGYETQSNVDVDQEDLKIVLKKIATKKQNFEGSSTASCDQYPFFQITPANEIG